MTNFFLTSIDRNKRDISDKYDWMNNKIKREMKKKIKILNEC